MRKCLVEATELQNDSKREAFDTKKKKKNRWVWLLLSIIGEETRQCKA